MSRLTDSAPPVRLGNVKANSIKHNSPLGPSASSSAPVPRQSEALKPRTGATGDVGMERIAVGEDPLGMMSSSPPPVAAQRVVSPPVPGGLTKVAPTKIRSPDVVTPIRPERTSINKQSTAPSGAIDEMVKSWMDRIKVPVMSTGNLQNNMETLEKLARASCWNSVVSMSEFILGERSVASNAMKNVSGYFETGNSGGGLHTAAKLRFEALFRTKAFDEVMNEADEVLRLERQRLDVENSKGITDTVILMRLLLAEVEATTGRGEVAVENFAHLLDDIVTAEKNNISGSSHQLRAWSWRVRWALVNTSLRGRYTSDAIKQLLTMLQELHDMDTQEEDESILLQVEEAKIVVVSRLSRTLLQVGALQAAIGYCDMAVAYLGEVTKNFPASSNLKQMSMQVNLTRALALFGINEYAEAMNLFEEIIDSEEARGEGKEVSLGGFASTFESLLCTEESLLCSAVNNYAVCALHLKQVDKSVSRLEDLVTRNPSRFIVDPVVFNLCTLYDLSCTPELATNKKKVLQRIASYGNLHEPLLNFKSFRLS